MTTSVHWFAQAALDAFKKIHDLSANTLNIGVCYGALPTVDTPAPHWGGTGTTDLSANQVATGGTSYTGPKTLASVTWTIVGSGPGVPTLRATDVTLAQDASGFTNATYAVIYNNTDANKRAIGWVDFGGTKTLATDALTIDWQGAGTDILTMLLG